MKGFGSGLIWGGVFGVAGLVIVSEVSPMPGEGGQAQPAAATEAVPATEPTAPAPAEPVAPAAGTAAPGAQAPQSGSAPGGAESPAAPADAPADGAAAPQDGAMAPAASVAPATEVVEAPAGSEFTTPPADRDPTAPSGNATVATGAAPAVQAPAEGSAPPLADTEAAEAPALDLAIPASPAAPANPPDAPVVAALDPPEVPAAPAAAPATPQPEAEPSAADLPPPPPLTPEEKALVETAPDIAPEGEAAVLPSDPPLAPVAPLPGTASTAVERPVAGFSGQVDGVTVGRLPRIGDDAAKAAAAAAEEPDPANEPPIVRYARPFENPEGRPVFAIVLVDSGDPALDRAKLAAMPFPVTFALDPTLPNVEDLAAPYRAAGQEVVMLATAIPQGATAADLEVTFAAHAAALPEAVAVLDLASGGFQNDRPLATQVVPIVKAQGRGLLTYHQGLNPADQVASREGLRAATVFRALDAENEPPTAIRRYLDRAAFKAAQDGRVVVVGSTAPQTIAALMEWSLEGRAAGVALAPLTGALVAR